MKTVTQRKIWLEERREDLLSRMARIEDALDGPFTQDANDGAIEHVEDEVLDQLGMTSQHEVMMIDAALARIVDGAYGTCVRCGEDISEKRLDVLPSTPFCAECAGTHA
jgi:RNA polymerase-binding transcription factor DksA